MVPSEPELMLNGVGAILLVCLCKADDGGNEQFELLSIVGDGQLMMIVTSE